MVVGVSNIPPTLMNVEGREMFPGAIENEGSM